MRENDRNAGNFGPKRMLFRSSGENNGWQSSHRSRALLTLGFYFILLFLQFIGKRVLSHVRLLSSNSRFFSSLFCAWLLRSNEKSMTIYGLFSTRFPNMSQTVGRFFGVCHANTRPGRFLTNSPLIDSLGTFVELPFIGQLVKKIP